MVMMLAVYMLCRLLFYFFNYASFEHADFSNTFFAFVHGLRYDLSILTLINLPFTIFSFLPFKFLETLNYQRFLKSLFIVINAPFILLNLIDIEFFKFTGKRTHFDILQISSDIFDQGFQLVIHYWFIPLLFTVLIFLIYKVYPSNQKATKVIPAWVAGILLPFYLWGSIYVIRGGFQYKPLRPNHAFIVSPNILGNVTLNTPFTFLMTSGIKGVEKVNYLNEEQLYQELKTTEVKEEQAEEKKDNVVIIILESFASEYIGAINSYKGYTPFLDSLIGESVFFSNHYANGTRSIEALPSILASIPAFMEEPYITSIYQSNQIKGLGSVLHQKGYHTSFFHGGKNGTMGFDVFAQNAGFLNYYGLNEYPDKAKDFDGNWGIFDEPFLQFYATGLSSFPQPFASCVFTLSSHQPYTIPKEHQGKFPKGTLDIHESIGYADYSLRQFFNRAKKESWYNNTLFIITADHTQMHGQPEYNNLLGDYKTPLLLFHPKGKIPVADTTVVAQHTDIMPTILDFLNIPQNDLLPFGKSLLEANEGVTINYSGGTYRLISKDYYLIYSEEDSRLFHISDLHQKHEITDQPDIKDKLEKKLKAHIQFYCNGLIENNWYELSRKLRQ